MADTSTFSRSDAVTVVSLWLLSLSASAYLILPASVLRVIQRDLGIDAAASWIISAPYAYSTQQ